MEIDLKKPIPLYRQVADIIRADILSGNISAGDQLASHQKLAGRYKVSLITIKRALNELKAEGFLFSRAGKGTYVHQEPSRKLTLGTKTIGMVLRDLKSPFFSLIVHSVEEYASHKGYNILISNSAQQIEKEENIIRHFYDIGVNGLIIASMTHEYSAPPFLRTPHTENYPCIMVSYVKDPDIYFVGTDHEKGGFLAADHLLSLGHRTLGYINGEEGNAVGDLRKDGFVRALQQHDVPERDQFFFRLPLGGESNDYSSGYAVGEEFLSLSRKPEAVFAYNDLAGLGFEQALLDKGVRVPDDIAIVGFDGIERGQYAPVPLTTVQQPFDRIGALAVENLIKRIEGQPVNTKTVLDPTLIVRESCGAKVKIIKEHS
ncbi:MAG: GntR family transcriptional regulator [Bacteroidota bacterium]